MLGKTTKDREETGDTRSTNQKGGSELSVISREMRIEGDCRTEGRIRIEGAVIGNVVAGAVELTDTGSIDGDVSTTEKSAKGSAVVIGGKVTGAVRASRVEVRKGGSIAGGLEADEAVVQGSVHGGVLARSRLALEDTAAVEGDVLAQRLSLQEGGQVNGNIRMGAEATKIGRPGGDASANSTAGKPTGTTSAERESGGPDVGSGAERGTERTGSPGELARAAS